MEPTNSSHSYLGYLDMTSKESSPEIMCHPNTIIKNVFGDVNLNSALAPAVLLSDFTTKEFVFAHKNCQALTGYSSKYFTDSGLESFLEKIHTEDFKKINGDIFAENFRVLQTINFNEMFDYTFCHSYRIKNKQGKYSTILQRFSYVLSQNNKPIGAIGYLSDISMFNNGMQMVHQIERLHKSGTRQRKEIIHNNNFFHNLENAVISKREVEILKWISEGFSSKQIAEKLKISPNTVNNHRKKMLQKTNCKNTAALLSFAASQRFL